MCLARALALRPDVLLLDEPCASLDPAATAKVEAALKGLSPTLLVVTHNLAQARRLADRTACLWPGPDGGRLVAEGPTPDVLDGTPHPELRAWLDGGVG